MVTLQGVDAHLQFTFSLVQFSGQGHVAPPSKYLAELLRVLAESESWNDIDLSVMVETPLRS